MPRSFAVQDHQARYTWTQLALLASLLPLLPLVHLRCSLVGYHESHHGQQKE